MVKNASENAREKLIASATELIRRNGYVATTVNEICAAAGVTKGAFFHHFASKEALAETCLDLWRQQFAGLLAGAPFQSVADPVERLVAAMDFFIRLFSNPQAVKSCLAGTVAQETSESNPVLRKGGKLVLRRARSDFGNYSTRPAEPRSRRSIPRRLPSCGSRRCKARFCFARRRATIRLFPHHSHTLSNTSSR